MDKKEYMDNVSNVRHYARISVHSHFLDIALASKREVKILKKQLEDDIAAGYEIVGEGWNRSIIMYRHDEIMEGEDALTCEMIKSVVFLAMYCEAYIWDLAASLLGDNYAQKYLDKLDTFSKWVVIPRMLFGAGLDVGHHSMETLKELIRWRNNFVHSKSKNVKGIHENPDKFKDEFIPLDQKIDLEDIFNKIGELFLQLRKVDPAGLHKLRTE
ncbi:hypothetical protein [Sphingobacterium arenae]|uniref:RiboL-PSP-HEPN domain-containing protein n=1 Tax=Sphingobacterium arenae TaxID=1280598 RepID=A0ABR7Y2Y1_9SPHI|nr:hypothetical protein [Sphingobacterium arenae]MBD1425675.1 hypothetical protein [Sphingobacterium arenae]